MSGGELEEKAKRALAAGEIEVALDTYQALELTFRHEPSWSRQVASLHERLGEREACLAALTRAAERCKARREVLKAIAACKLIHALDPTHEGATRILDQLLEFAARLASDRMAELEGLGTIAHLDPARLL